MRLKLYSFQALIPQDCRTVSARHSNTNSATAALVRHYRHARASYRSLRADAGQCATFAEWPLVSAVRRTLRRSNGKPEKTVMRTVLRGPAISDVSSEPRRVLARESAPANRCSCKLSFSAKPLPPLKTAVPSACGHGHFIWIDNPHGTGRAGTDGQPLYKGFVLSVRPVQGRQCRLSALVRVVRAFAYFL